MRLRTFAREDVARLQRQSENLRAPPTAAHFPPKNTPKKGVTDLCCSRVRIYAHLPLSLVVHPIHAR